MFIYILLLVYLIALFYIYDVRGVTKYRFAYYVFSCIILILVAGLRYRVGLDTNAYMRSFNQSVYPYLEDFSFFHNYGADIGWVFINSIAKSVGCGFYTVQIIQALIVNIVVFWFIRRHSPKPFLGILLFFMFQWWNYCFEAMRESIAIAFYLLALDGLITKNSLKSYYLRVWPAALVHTFGFVTFLFPLIRYIKVNKYLPFIAVAFLGVFFFIGDIINDLVESMAMMEGMAADKAMEHLSSDTYGESSLSIVGILMLLMSRAIPMLWMIIVLQKDENESSKTFIPYLICYILVVLLRLKVPIFFRFYNYFEVMMIVAMTQAVTITAADKKSLKHAVTCCMILLMIFVRTYELTKVETGSLHGYKTYNRYIPYNSIFTEDYNEESEYVFRSLE